MPQLLLELFSEEIPARMQKRAEEDLARAFGEKLKAHGLEAKALKTFSSPRRLGLVIDDLPAKAADVNEEKKGPRVGAPDQAVQGFLKSAGLASIDQAQVVEDKKGAFYVAKIERAGRASAAIVQEIVPEIVRAFPWPKSMRSGESDLQWVRPLHNVLCLFDGAPVKIEIDGVGSKPETFGHRFHAPGAILPKDFADYSTKLRAAKVLIDREERKALILEAARKLCAGKGLELVEDIGLLEEVAGLVEWPVTLLGDMDPAFLDLPGEVIRLSMRTHQKYFAVRDPKSGKLAPHFITVANVEAKDGGKAIAAGNARVLSARLNDARFFWETDRKTPLGDEVRLGKLQKLVFHKLIGSVWDKVERTRELGVWLTTQWPSPTAEEQSSYARCVMIASSLSKADLVVETVGEFPELQGQVGRQLFLIEFKANNSTPNKWIESEAASVAAAIEDHYRPTGAGDRVATDRVAYTIAVADKADTLFSFWLIGEKPTGSKDPYALRRAGIGLIRTLLENDLRISLSALFEESYRVFIADWNEGQGAVWPLESRASPIASDDKQYLFFAEWGQKDRVNFDQYPMLGFFKTVTFDEPPLDMRDMAGRLVSETYGFRFIGFKPEKYVGELLEFLADRLKVQLRDQGKRHDLVDAVFALGDDDLVRIVARVEALDAFLKTEDGANLLAGSKRATKLLADEEKKGRWSAEEAAGEVDAAKLVEAQEKALYAALQTALPAARAAVEKEDFAAAMKALAGLRAPVDAFFEKVLVNADDAMLRRNRLLLLSRLREALSAVADFSKIEG